MSMTGFGRSEKQNGTVSCKIEIRSVNNRFIDINTRLPKHLNSLELPLKKLIKKKCARGSFDVFVTLEKTEGQSELEIQPNLELAEQYHKAFQQIQEKLGATGNISIESFIGLKDIIKSAPQEPEEDTEPVILEAVEEAMTALIEMRKSEGTNLESDILGRIDGIAKNSEIISARQPEVVAEYKDKLQERIRTLSEGVDLDPSRLAQETAVLADRSDIAEELTRLESHIEQFRKLVQSKEPIGRKLEFLTQEINREVNTIGSKSQDYEISQAVIENKSLLEKIREQLQNIE